MSIVAVAGLKGGSGKSLTTITLAGELMRRGRNVMVVDGDRHRAPSRWIARGRPPIQLHTLRAPLLQPDHLVELVTREDRIALIDAPSDDREAQWNVLMAADLALLPNVPSQLSRDAWPSTYQLVLEATRLRPWLKVGVLATGGDATIDANFAPYPIPEEWRWPVQLPRRPQHERALLDALPVGVLAPRSRAAREAAELTNELERRLPPPPHTESNENRLESDLFDVEELERTTASKRID